MRRYDQGKAWQPDKARHPFVTGGIMGGRRIHMLFSSPPHPANYHRRPEMKTGNGMSRDHRPGNPVQPLLRLFIVNAMTPMLKTKAAKLWASAMRRQCGLWISTSLVWKVIPSV